MTFLLSFRTNLHNETLKTMLFLLYLSDNVLYFGCAFFLFLILKHQRPFLSFTRKEARKKNFFFFSHLFISRNFAHMIVEYLHLLISFPRLQTSAAGVPLLSLLLPEQSLHPVMHR